MARANRHLDRDLRTLDLTPQQRQAIRTAQRARDMVTENARYWYNAAARAEARADFELALDNILSSAQRGLLTATRQLLTNRAEAMATAETEAPHGA